MSKLPVKGPKSNPFINDEFGDMALGPDGLLYVSTTSTLIDLKLYKFDTATGKYKGTLVAESAPSTGSLVFAFGPDSNLYVDGLNSVLRFNGRNGRFIDEFCRKCFADRRIAFGPDMNLYLTSGDSAVRVYNGQTGSLLETIYNPPGMSLNASGIAFGPDGNLYLSNSLQDNVFRYQRISSKWVFKDVFVHSNDGGLSKPTDLAFGKNGNLYLASYDTRSVKEYDGNTGTFVNDFVPPYSGGLYGPMRLLFLPGTLIDLSVKVSAKRSITVGRTLIYTFTVANKSIRKSSGSSLTADLSGTGSFSYSRIPSSCGVTGKTIRCNIGSLGAKTKKLISIRVRAETKGVLYCNADIHGNDDDPVTLNNVSSIETTIK